MDRHGQRKGESMRGGRTGGKAKRGRDRGEDRAIRQGPSRLIDAPVGTGLLLRIQWRS